MKYKELIKLNENFNKSTNILLDKFECEDFIKTSTLNEILDKLDSSYSLNAYALIGAFGSGKSTILLYLDKYFKGECGSNKNYLVIKILGEYNSFVDSFNKTIQNYIEIEDSILKTLEKLDKFSKQNYDGFVIIIDELGKFIDYSVESLNSDIYELQNIAEFVNKSDNYLFVSLHKSFMDYKIPFSEWDKIQGRFENILMRDDYSEVIKILKKSINLDENSSKNLITKIVKEYKLDKNFIELSPLHPFSVIALSELFNKYFQNQRTLFSFIFSAEKFAFRDFLECSPPKLYNLANLFDYVDYLIKVYNVLIPDKEVYYLSLVRIKEAQNEIDIKIIKTIGLVHSFKLNIKTDKKGIIYSLIDEFEENEIEKRINYLIQNSIIVFQESSKSYALIENSNININKELEKRLNYNYDYKEIIKQLFTTKIAKRYFVEYGNKIEFNETFKIKEFSVIYDTKEIQIPKNSVLVIYENEKIIKDLSNKIAALEDIKKEYKILTPDTLEILNSMIEDNFVSLKKVFFNSLRYIIYDKKYNYSYKLLQDILSKIAFEVANKAVIINNYTLTHTNKKATITTMLRQLFIAMFENSDKKDLGIEKYPAHKALYLSVIKPAGFHKFDGEKYYLSEPDNLNFDIAFDEIKKMFIQKQPILNFIEKMKKSPFMINELISIFVLDLFLIVNKNQIHLYREGNFVFEINSDILIDILKQPKKFELEYVVLNERELEVFKAYLEIFKSEAEIYDVEKSIKIIKEIYSRFKKLPPYSLNTKNLSSKAIKLRSKLLSIRDIKQGFFVDVVDVLGFENKEQFINDFRKYFNEIMLSFTKMKQDLNQFIDKEFSLVDKNVDKYEAENKLIVKSIIENDLEGLSFLIMKKSLQEFYDNDIKEFKKILKQKSDELLNLSDLDKNTKKIVIYEKDKKIEKFVKIDLDLKNEIQKLKQKYSDEEIIFMLSEMLKDNNETT